MAGQKQCHIDDCDKMIHAKGMCHTHYYRSWKNGHTEAKPAPVRMKDTPCKVEGCDTLSVSKWMCHRHYGLAKYHKKKEEKPMPTKPKGQFDRVCKSCKEVKKWSLFVQDEGKEGTMCKQCFYDATKVKPVKTDRMTTFLEDLDRRRPVGIERLNATE